MTYGLLRALFRIVAKPMFRFEVQGAERVPRNGPGVVVAPHRSWLDPACVGGACPRPVHFLILRSVYDRPALRWLYRRLRVLPVRPGDGLQSVASLRGALRLLRDGELVGVFPEGRVFPRDRPGVVQPGAAMLAAHTGAPVIPMLIDGSDRAWPHGRGWPGPAKVRVRIGAPIVPGRERGREPLAELVRCIERELGLDPQGRRLREP